jgi:hypothetical protein
MYRRHSFASIVPALLVAAVGCDPSPRQPSAEVHDSAESSLDTCSVEGAFEPTDIYDPMTCSCLDVVYNEPPTGSEELVTEPCDVDPCDFGPGGEGGGGGDAGGSGGGDFGGYGGFGGFGGGGDAGGDGGFVSFGGYGGTEASGGGGASGGSISYGGYGADGGSVAYGGYGGYGAGDATGGYVALGGYGGYGAGDATGGYLAFGGYGGYGAGDATGGYLAFGGYGGYGAGDATGGYVAFGGYGGYGAGDASGGSAGYDVGSYEWSFAKEAEWMPGVSVMNNEIEIVVELIRDKIHVYISGNTLPPGIPVKPGDIDATGKIVNKDLINKIVAERNALKTAFGGPGTKIKYAPLRGISIGIGTVFFLLLEGSAAAGQFAGEQVNEWTAKANRGQSCNKLAAWMQKTKENPPYACGQVNCEDCYYAWIETGVSNATLSACMNEMNAAGTNTVALEAKIAELAQSVVGLCGSKGSVEGGVRKTRKRGGYGAPANKPNFNFKPGGSPGELPGLEAVCPVDPGWSFIP